MTAVEPQPAAESDPQQTPGVFVSVGSTWSCTAYRCSSGTTHDTPAAHSISASLCVSPYLSNVLSLSPSIATVDSLHLTDNHYSITQLKGSEHVQLSTWRRDVKDAFKYEIGQSEDYFATSDRAQLPWTRVSHRD